MKAFGDDAPEQRKPVLAVTASRARNSIQIWQARNVNTYSWWRRATKEGWNGEERVVLGGLLPKYAIFFYP
jgi:hypothetical protein